MKSNAAYKLEVPVLEKEAIALQISDLNVSFGANQVLKDISMAFHKNKVNCIIGPSGGGKSTLLRSLNRMNDDAEKMSISGAVNFNNSNILNGVKNLTQLRKDIGMVFQSPCVFPKSIAENVLFGIQQHKKINKQEKRSIVENNLKEVALWKEVEHRLKDSGHSLSIGQQQRLCIARALAIEPEIILMDEPTSSLDPVSTRSIENLMERLKENYTVVLVTHNIAQAKRIADHVFFICDGKLIESGSKADFFNNPKKPQTKSYLQDETCICK
ncbi:phosphate ABC transporter ATP-binding protein [Lacinutrix chionoecetis]